MPKCTFIFHTDKPTKELHKDILIKEKVSNIPDYSTISRRINRLDIKVSDTTQKSREDYLVIAIDSTGIKSLIEFNG